MRVLILWVLILWIPHSRSFAQTDSLQSRLLDEVVISATRTEQPVLKTPRSVSIIDQQQLEESIYNSIGDLLSRQEGIYLVGATQTPGANQSLFMRGASGNQVLVMIDGIRITDPSTPNNAIDLSELSPAQVERIEIIKGSHSTLYGSAAVGGVVNIITKKGGQHGLTGSATLLGGSMGENSGTLSQQLNMSYSFSNGIYFDASAFNQNTRGLNSALDTLQNRTTEPDRDNFSKTDGSLTLGYRKSAIDAFVSYRSTHQRTDIDDGAYTDDDNNYLDFYRNFWSYGVTYNFNPAWSLKAIGSVSNSRRLNEDDSTLVMPGVYDHSYFIGSYYGDLTTLEGQLTYSGSGIEGIFGAGSYQEKMNFDTYFFSSAFGGFESEINYDSIITKSTISYVFSQLNIKAGSESKLNFTLGSRYSHHSMFGSFLTYEISPSYELSRNSLLYVSYSTSFNAPSLYQLYDPTQSTSSFTRGNPNLDPEEAQSLEIGMKKGFSKGQYLTASLFTTYTADAIEYVYVWNKNTPIANLSFLDYLGDTYINLSSQKVSGVEVSGMASHGRFDLSGNFTWLTGSIVSKPEDVPGEYIEDNHVQLYSTGAFLDTESQQDNLVRRPQIMAMAKLKYNSGDNFSVFTNYRLAGTRFDSFYDPSLGPFGALGRSPIDEYHLIDLGANYRVNRNLHLAMNVENIFDVRYQEINGFSTRGRSLYAKVIFKW